MSEDAEVRATLRLANRFRVCELKDALRKISHVVSGKKEDLLQRLVYAISAGSRGDSQLAARAKRAVHDVYRQSTPVQTPTSGMKAPAGTSEIPKAVRLIIFAK